MEKTDNHIDDHVEDEIKACFNKENPKCFFTFAGAGSGKTRSLVNALSYIDSYIGADLEKHSQQVAVITYTNAACEEILNRVDYKPIFEVSTIHSFLWELIKNHQRNIKEWIIKNILFEIVDLKEKEAKGRESNASIKRKKDITKKNLRLEKVRKISKFSYNPNGENLEYDSLNHSEVVKMASEFILDKPIMQKILISKFPILLIDEGQDTKKELMDSLLKLCISNPNKIIIGIFGDTMQKIYQDGKDDLEQCIPDEWEKPSKEMNHRSAKRIVTLANSIRKEVDGKKQRYRNDVDDGTVRLFIANYNDSKINVEKFVNTEMYKITKDKKWLHRNEIKVLILEHHMAASRLDFFNLFMPLYKEESLKNSVLDGSLLELRFFIRNILPLASACQSKNKFEIAKIIKKNSSLFNKKLVLNKEKQLENIILANQAVNEFSSLWKEEKIPSCLEIIANIEKSGLFQIPSRLQKIYKLDETKIENSSIKALYKALSSSFMEMKNYSDYISGNASFDTHQGVKGLEFPRVVVIMDDNEANGFLFSYEKLFSAKSKSTTDIKNEKDKKENSISRTSRLFYVACTRAQESLAIIAYTGDSHAVESTAIKNKWFTKKEVIHIDLNENKLLNLI